MRHVVIYGQLPGMSGLVRLTCAHGESAADLNRAAARALREVADRFEVTADRIVAAATGQVQQEQPARRPDPVFDRIAAQLRAEGMGDGTAG